MDLLQFLRKNNEKNNTDSNRAHDSLIESIQNSPKTIGLSNIVETFREVKMSSSKGTFYADLILRDTYNGFYVVEAKTIKSNSSDRKIYNVKKKIQKQLNNYYQFIKFNYKILVGRIGVYKIRSHNNLNIIKIKKSPLDIFKYSINR